MPMYGWYSQQAANIYGSCIYENQQGQLIEVTCILEGFVDNDSRYEWKDKVLIGEVKKFIRTNIFSTRKMTKFRPIEDLAFSSSSSSSSNSSKAEDKDVTSKAEDKDVTQFLNKFDQKMKNILYAK